MTVVYLGVPLGALALLHDGHDVVLAAISRPDLPGMRRLRRQLAERRALLLVQPDLDDPTVRELLVEPRASLLVSWFWTKRIPREVIASATRAFNVHPSLLPRWRGPDPYYWTLRSRDPVTGVTAHVLADDYDTGDVLAQRTVEVPEGVDAWQLARRLDRPSLALMRETARRYRDGETLVAIAQDESSATLAPQPDDAACEIDWHASTDDVLAQIRAAAPAPGAFTGYGDDADAVVVVLAAHRAREVPRVLDPGEMVATREGVVVRTADGAVVLDRAVREGGGGVVEGRAIIALFTGITVLE